MRRFAPVLLLLLACGPTDRTTPTADAVDAGAGSGGQQGEAVTLTGTVWAPGNGPGLVPPGHEIPVANALVYLSTVRPPPIVQAVECTLCVEAPSSSIVTDAKGNFSLAVYPGTYWLVIQKAQFRLEQEIVITPATVLSHEQTTLPSVHDPDGGQWIPRIALVLGYSGDPMESILGKMGIGQVDASGAFIGSSAAGRFDVYTNGGRSIGMSEQPVSSLVNSLDTMLQYHVIFFPCATASTISILRNDSVLRNIRDYVAAGGRLYVSDWSAEWVDNVFPTQVELAGASNDTPPAAYNAATDTWNPDLFGDADASPPYTSASSVIEPTMAEWLDGQVGAAGPINASAISTLSNFNRIHSVHDVSLGVDDLGQQVVDSPKVYVTGTAPGWDSEIKPLTVTFEPAGCGRVMYSTFHTTSSAHVGLLPQERILVYLLLELGVCKDDVVVD
jgi:hypothetical protein